MIDEEKKSMINLDVQNLSLKNQDLEERVINKS
jgi:hypothetical protein